MKLLSCPFCGGKAVVAHVGTYSKAGRCTECGATGPRVEMADYCTKSNYMLRLLFKAGEAWNKRVEPI